VKAYLAIQGMFLNESAYLREWIEFHRLVGVERFFLYDHESTDSSREVLAPYVEDGSVVLHDWPVQPGLVEGYNDCLKRHRDDAHWIAFMDVDEFLFSPTGTPVPEVLGRFEHLPGLGIPWALFGMSGHKSRPAGLVIENYTERSTRPRRSRWFKSIVQPPRVSQARGPHVFAYWDDLDLYPVPAFTPFDLLRINHYWTKSEQEFNQKLARPWPHTGQSHRAPFKRGKTITSEGFATTDEAILSYLPALREAIAAREAGQSAPPAGAGRDSAR
jgi:hypothetical protein